MIVELDERLESRFEIGKLIKNSAFPVGIEHKDGNIYAKGLTKREYFASMRRFESISPENAKLLMGKDLPEYGTIEYLRYSAEAIEKLSVLAADALIKALNQSQP